MRFYLILFILVISCGEANYKSYPSIENVKEIESHFGIEYTNEFANLEDFKKPEKVSWFKSQDSLTETYFKTEDFESYLKKINSFQDRPSHFAKDIKYDEANNTYYLREIDGSEMLFKRVKDSEDGHLIFNPKTFESGGFVIGYYAPSYNGNYTALALSSDDNFFDKLIIVENSTSTLVENIDAQIKPDMVGGIIWGPSSNSILFTVFPNKLDETKLRNSFLGKYEIGQEINKPTSIFASGDVRKPINEEFYILPKVRSKSDNYIFAYVANANDFWDCYFVSKKDYQNGTYNWKLLFEEEDKVLHDYGTEYKNQFIFKRILGDNVHLSQINLVSPTKEFETLYKSKAGEQLSNFKVTSRGLYFTTSLNGIEEKLYKYEDSNNSKEIELPKSTGEIVFDYRSPYQEELWLQLNGWTINFEEYRLSSDDNIVQEPFGSSAKFDEFDEIISSVYEVESHDGVRVPVSIVFKKGFKKNKSTKAIVAVYGAYGFNESPWFHEPILDFINDGNIYVVAHVRGGGEKGPQWHEQGMLHKKSNSWLDLISCVDYLVDNQWVDKEKIGVNTNSAGGITVGMALNVRPDLFGAVTMFNGAVNVARTSHIEGYDATDTSFEFGSENSKEEFESLIALDPVINFDKSKNYPSTLLMMGYKDYLIPPSSNAKLIALMQSNSKVKDNNYLLDVNFEGEHDLDWYVDYAKAIYFINKELD